MPLNNETLTLLKLKYPQPKKTDKNAVLSDILERTDAVKFESIDAELLYRLQ